MSETYVIVRIQAEQEDTINRIRYYLQAKTRPDFIEDVPIDEQDIFSAMESVEVPQKVKKDNPLTLTAWFELIGISDISTLFKALDHFKGVTSRYAFYEDEEYKIYFGNRDGKQIPIYTCGDNEDTDELLSSLEWDTKAFDWVIKNMGD